MTPTEVHALLAENSDRRGQAHWAKRYADSPLTSHGIGLTKLRKLAKQVGRNHQLSAQLWQSDVYDARVVALLIAEPGKITRAQAEAQVDQLGHGQLEHVFASCDASLAKVSWVAELAESWVLDGDAVRRRCGYGLIYELSKSKKKSAPDPDWFSRWVCHIDDCRDDADPDELLAMASALMGIGKRSAQLNFEAIGVARAIGPVDFDPTGACDPFDAVKHLDSDWLKKKLGITR